MKTKPERRRDVPCSTGSSHIRAVASVRVFKPRSVAFLCAICKAAHVKQRIFSELSSSCLDEDPVLVVPVNYFFATPMHRYLSSDLSSDMRVGSIRGFTTQQPQCPSHGATPSQRFPSTVSLSCCVHMAGRCISRRPRLVRQDSLESMNRQTECDCTGKRKKTLLVLTFKDDR